MKLSKAIKALVLANAELRGAMVVAGKRIVKLSPKGKRDPVLPTLRRVIRETEGYTINSTRDGVAAPVSGRSGAVQPGPS